MVLGASAVGTTTLGSKSYVTAVIAVIVKVIQGLSGGFRELTGGFTS